MKETITKKVRLFASTTALLLAASIPASAASIAVPPTDNYNTYNYVIDLPNIAPDGTETDGTAQFSFTVSDGPFGLDDSMYSHNSVFDTFGTSGILDNDYSLIALTTTGYVDTDGAKIVELYLQYQDPSSDILSFTFVEPVAFWATGGDQSFPTGTTPETDLVFVDYSNPPDPVNGYPTTWVTSTTGAFFKLGVDPACTSCSISTTVEPVTATPEPSSLWLLSSGVIGLLGMARRKICAIS